MFVVSIIIYIWLSQLFIGLCWGLCVWIYFLGSVFEGVTEIIFFRNFFKKLFLGFIFLGSVFEGVIKIIFKKLVQEIIFRISFYFSDLEGTQNHSFKKLFQEIIFRISFYFSYLDGTQNYIF